MKLYLIITVFLLSDLHYYQAEGTRLGSLIFSATNHQEIIKISSIKGSHQHNELLAKTDELSSSSTLAKKRSLSYKVVVIKRSHNHDHWLPKIHEDYFGPRHHMPRHH
ncbi:uncharacterized protein [Rutidosis leptorrhynchoides]|uniref:uncharacterized protein n=1 Tax=Rutidosis leptorrhynchoides TaxID=125765 RepID=UPI003A99359D